MTQNILRTLLEVSVYAAVLFGAIWMFRWLLGAKAGPRLRLALWALLAARLLIPMTYDVPFRPLALPMAAQASVQPSAVPSPVTAAPVDLSAGLPLSQASVQRNATEVDTREVSALPVLPPSKTNPVFTLPALDWRQALLALWLAGTLATAGVFLAQSLRLWRVLRSSGSPDWRLRNMLHDVALSLGLRRTPPLRVTPDGSPALTASLRPVLLLPAWMLDMGDGELSAALRHELTHYRRGDHLLALGLIALRCVYWFHPAVWLMAPAVREDIELACDAVAVAPMGPQERRTYAATLLALYGRKPRPRLALAMAGSARRVAERRIRSVFSPVRTAPAARLGALALAAVLLFGCFTTACQPTPTTPAVVNKNNGKLEEAIRTTATPAPSIACTADLSAGAPTPIPTPTPHLKMDFPGKDPKVTFHIDADLQGASGPIPVVRVRPHEITMDQVKQAAQVLFEGNPAYAVHAGMTKDEIQKQLIKTQAHISDWKKLVAYYGGDEKTAKDVKEEFTKRIQQYQEMLKTAPDTVERQPTDWTFRPQSDYIDMAVFGDVRGNDREANDVRDGYNKSREIILTSDVGEYRARMDVYNLSTDSQVEHRLQFMLGTSTEPNTGTPMWDDGKLQPMTMTEQQAAELALQKLDALGLQGYTASQIQKLSVPDARLAQLKNADDKTKLKIASGELALPTGAPGDDRPYGYSVTLVRTYNGIPAAGGQDSVGSRKENLGPRYQYEGLAVVIQNDRVTSLSWIDPLEDVQVENDNVQTLSQEEILAAFQKQMQLEYNVEKLSRDGAENAGHKELVASITAADVTITRAQLVLWRMLIKDQPGQYRMVPVWMFYGHESVTVKGLAPQPMATGNIVPAGTPGPATGTNMEMEPLILYLGINALDGSVINPYAGY